MDADAGDRVRAVNNACHKVPVRRKHGRGSKLRKPESTLDTGGEGLPPTPPHLQPCASWGVVSHTPLPHLQPCASWSSIAEAGPRHTARTLAEGTEGGKSQITLLDGETTENKEREKVNFFCLHFANEAETRAREGVRDHTPDSSLRHSLSSRPSSAAWGRSARGWRRRPRCCRPWSGP